MQSVGMKRMTPMFLNCSTLLARTAALCRQKSTVGKVVLKVADTSAAPGTMQVAKMVPMTRASIKVPSLSIRQSKRSATSNKHWLAEYLLVVSFHISAESNVFLSSNVATIASSSSVIALFCAIPNGKGRYW